MQNFETLPELLGTIRFYYREENNKRVFDHIEHVGGNLVLMTKRFLHDDEENEYIKRRKNATLGYKVGDVFYIENIKFRVLRFFPKHDCYLVNIENMEFLPEHD